MQTSRYEFLVEAIDPISHEQESLGNASIFCRKKVTQPNGQRVMVAYISGDSIRHQLREAAAYATLHAAGLLDDPQLSEGALRLLFAGGMVTGKGDAAVINLDSYRKLAALFPPLALFGGCTDNRPLPGQIIVDEGNLVCTETIHHAPQWIHGWLDAHKYHIESCRSAVEEVTRVRMDPSLLPEKRHLLSDVARANVEARLLTSERAHETGDAKAKQESKSAMLPRTHERIVQGSLLWCGVEARTYSDVEFDAFAFTLACLLNNFRVGGRGATGHGRLRFVAGARIAFAPSAGSLEQIGAELAPKVGELYKAHVVAHKDELAAWIRGAVNS